MKIVTVLRSGGDYNHEHVQWLYKQLPDDIEKICFTDLTIPGVQTIRLTENLTGWWSKIEIYDPGKVNEDIFYIDLDVGIVGDLTDILQNTRLTMLSDFFFPQKTKNSAIMRIPHEEKYKVWEAFKRYPELFMSRYQSGGDQEFISKIYPQAAIWQDILPGQIVSYKKHVIAKKKNEHATGNGSVPPGTRIVCFHGKPRPWDCGEAWVPPFVKS